MKNFLKKIGFAPKENASGVFQKKYPQGCIIEIDFEKEKIKYGTIKADSETTSNFSQVENWVVLECVNRLLEKGYKPENIVLEKIWPSGHGTSGRLDICVTRDDGSEYLLIECKTWGKEFEKEFSRMKKDGGQLFTYFKFSNKADVIMLYASQLQGEKIEYKNEIVKIEEEYRTGDMKDFYEKWNKLTKDNGVFDEWVTPYCYISKALTPEQLQPITQEDSGFIFNQFLEILRHNVVSDKPNAFNKIFTLFLCKVYDEKTTKENEELKFQWLEGKDTDVSFQIRLTDLYKNGMLEFLEKQVTDFSEDDFEKKYKNLDDSVKKLLLEDFFKVRLQKNNEFAIKEVFDEPSFKENAKVVKEVVELLQKFRIRYNKRQQYLSDFFELLLTTGLKQESGQFFTPVPIAQFIIKSLPIDTLLHEKLEKGERNNLLPYIIDYAAGSGHFLTESMHEIQRLLNEKNSNSFIADTAKKVKAWKEDHFDWATQYVYGIEKDYRLVKVGKVGCYLHGDGLANVILSDGLANFQHADYKGKLKEVDATFPRENKQFDIVISNPPYSVSSFKNTSSNYYTKEDFELYEKLTDSSSEIECLFIERTKQLLKDGGIAGIILPSSILSNTNLYTKAREIILEYFDIIAIAELGSNTFMATGTNTVTLFLKRRNNYETVNLKGAIAKFATTLQEVTLNGVEKPISKYVAHVWEGLSIEDYKTLFQKAPNNVVKNHEIFQDYEKKLKVKNEKEFWELVIEREKEKLKYFVLAYPQQVVLVKSGEKDAEKQFLGYEFSNRRGSEGIHPMQRGKTIDECTQLFDLEIFDNPEKASTYVYKAFQGDYKFPIAESLQKNISRHALVDMMIFDRAEFEKTISLSVKKKLKIESQWELVKLGELIELQYGKGLPEKERKEGGYPVMGSNGIVGYHNEFLIKGPSIIIGRKGSAGKVNIVQENNFPIDTTFYVDIKSPKVSFSFCSVLLKYLEKDLEDLNAGVGPGGLNRNDAYEIKVPLPPKDIQQKIVDEMEVLEKREEEMMRKIEQIKDSLRFVVQNNSKEERLGNICEIQSGGTPSRQNQSFWNGNINWIRSEVCQNQFVYENQVQEKITEEGLKKSSAKILKRDTVLIALVGATIGKVGYLTFESTTNQNIVGLYPLNANELLPKYLFYSCIQLYPNFAYKAGEFKMANLSFIKNLRIPLPPLAEQQRIVAEIEKIEEEIEKLEAELAEIPAKKEEILKKYL